MRPLEIKSMRFHAINLRKNFFMIAYAFVLCVCVKYAFLTEKGDVCIHVCVCVCVCVL